MFLPGKAVEIKLIIAGACVQHTIIYIYISNMYVVKVKAIQKSNVNSLRMTSQL